MDIDFIIPLNFQDLASDQSDGYYVEKIYEPNQIDKKLGDAEIDQRNDGPVAIVKTFDTFYSVLHHMSRLKSEIVERAWELCTTNFVDHIKALPIILDPEGIEATTRKVQLNVLKMEAYILVHFIEEFESEAAKPGVIVNVGKGKSKSTSKKPSHGEFDWPSERVDILKSINDLMQLEIQRLWNPPIVEEQFTGLFSTACYKMLENQAIVRQTESKDLIFQILGLLIKRFNHRLGACLKIIQLLQHFEHLVTPLACAVEVFVNQFGARILVGDIVREIGSKDSAEFSRDTSGTKSFSSFLVEIAVKVPEVVLPNLSLLMVHLDNEAYTMRNGVLSVFGEIIAKVLNKEDLDENMKKTRESLLSTLEDHVHDITAFVRSKVIQIWMQLFLAKVVPLSRQGGVVDLIIGRLGDKSANVRKYAVQFLKVALTGNPYGAKLTMNVLKESLEKELTKLAEMEPQEMEEEAPVMLVDADWTNMKKVVRVSIKKFVSDDDMDDWEHDDGEQWNLYQGQDDALDK
jgi:condensin complex subunit 1